MQQPPGLLEPFSMPDVFICHASEDKTDVARPLARLLSGAGLDVWFDEYSLKLGDSLRRAIDRGLADSQYGVVLLSPAFFEKDWPQAELDGLFAKEIGKEKAILPVWHNIDREEVLKHSPILADRFAAKTASGLDEVVMRILAVVVPDTSHRTSSGHTVAVKPSDIRLHSGKWAVKTPLTVTNFGDDPVHSVQVKLALHPTNLDPRSIHVDLGEPTTQIEEPVSWAAISPDAMLHFFQDGSRGLCLSVILHTILPKTSREIQVAGTKPIKSSASVELWDFNTKPPEVLRQGGQVAFPLSVPEDVTSKGIAMLIRKRK